MYLIYSLKNNKVIRTNDKPFASYDKNLYNECFVEDLPIKTITQYYEVFNVREEVKVIEEAYSIEEIYFNKVLGVDEVKVVEYPAETKTYLTCDVVVRDRPQMSEEEMAKMVAKRNALKEIEELKQKLKDTDYQAIKYAEGYFSYSEYLPIKEQRQAWRNKINELEGVL